MVPVEILEDIFAYLSRDALDHCEIICFKWNKVIETSKRLTQHRIVSWKFYNHYCDGDNLRFLFELKSSAGKSFHIYYYSTVKGSFVLENSKLLEFRVFKNVIIDELVENFLYSIDFLEERWMNIFKLADVRIIVKRVCLYFPSEILKGNILLKGLHDLLIKYIDADEIAMNFIYPEHENDEDELLFNKESWKYFDFEKKTEFNLRYDSNILPINFPFKEFISGKHMEHSKLNELKIYLYKIAKHVVVHSIVEAFCNTDEPQKFFKIIKTNCYPYTFDKIFDEFGFVCEDQELQKYRLSHPKLKWALEAIQPDEYGFHYLKFKSIEL